MAIGPPSLSVGHEADDPGAGVHDSGLSPDGERELPGQDDGDLLFGVVVCRGDGVGFEGDEVRDHGVGGHGAELEARDHGQRLESFDADEPSGRV